jgi:hypothetical protein
MSTKKTVTATMERVTKITPIIINIEHVEFIARYSNKNLRLCQQTENNKIIYLKKTI